MTVSHSVLPILIFAATLLLSFLMAYLGRRHSTKEAEQILNEQKLGRWLIGLSAGATANSGFVVTAAVGLGYSYGVQWLMLPLSWLLGDAVFWVIFPQRINSLGRKVGAATLSDLLVSDLPQPSKNRLRTLVGVVILVCLGGYLSAQWLAGQKFLAGAFGFSGLLSLAVFAAVITCYTAIGGFRGSVYVDSFQALVRVAGTALALAAVCWHAKSMGPSFWQNIASAGPDFLRLFPQGSFVGAVGLVLGFAFAALGFGLGQPQIVTRYLAGATPKETQASWWIYLSFVQTTWLAMTLFGVVLRGIMPMLPDPEEGLSLFFRTFMGPVLTGIIVADIFATIAATSNSLLVAISQTALFDVAKLKDRVTQNRLAIVSLAAGGVTMAAGTVLGGSVFGLALSSVSYMAAGIAPAVMVRVLGFRANAFGLGSSVLVGLVVAYLWKSLGLSSFMNEAAPGFVSALAVLVLVSSLIGAPRAAQKEA
jgi:Na+/proline symporter